jgi:low affinity Fe/Cu permease
MVPNDLRSFTAEMEPRHRPARHRPKLSERISHKVTTWAGSTWAFGTAAGIILLWLLSGPLFHFSDTWQLVINTGTTIVTFLMVFLIQRSQNKEAKAVALKLNEIVVALDGASNRLVGVEDLSERDLETLHRHYEKLAALAAEEEDVGRSHSVDEAEARHHEKRSVRRRRARRKERDHARVGK